MNELLFHSSWWLLACVAAGGVAVFIFGNRRADKNLQRIGLAIVAVALILGLLRFFFPTPRERMENRARAIVRTVDHHDWTRLHSLLDPDTAVCNRSSVIFAGRDAIVAHTQAAVDMYHVKSVSVLGIDSDQTETLVTVRLEIYSEQEAGLDRPVTSSWQMDFQQSGDDWILEKITALRIGSEGNQDFIPRFPN